MRRKSRLFSLVFLILLSTLSKAFAIGGVLAESSLPLHVIQTQYFDIIFPEESRESALKIASVCDDYYIEITSLLETEPYQRFPVTITHSVENLNAYYAAIPYNRIVLFDTAPDTSLDMYGQTIQSVFYHELTHAVTYNMKSDIFKTLSFFADCMNPAWLTVTTFWAEGATVSFESKGRGGRLNDPFSTQIANQSVVEGHFPSWRDVTGARDTFPGGTDAYIFGSMFAAYLQETYGMKKYADFWKKAGSSISFSFIAGVFKKTYGNSVTKVWKDFEKTLKIDAEKKNVKAFSHKKSLVSTFDAFFCENGDVKIAYFDSVSSSLRLAVFDSNGKLKKNKKLLAITGITRVVFSPNGTKLALSRLIDKKNYKYVTAEYDLIIQNYVEHKETGRKEAYYKIIDGRAEFSELLLSELNEELLFSPIWVDENLCAAIVKDELNWRIRLYDSEKTLCEYEFSKNLILHNLHRVRCNDSEILLSFTWAELGMGGKMLSRAGFLKIDRASGEATASLQKNNSFAGFLEAVPSLNSDDESNFSLFAIAAEYEKKPLYKINMTESDFEEAEVVLHGEALPDKEQIAGSEPDEPSAATNAGLSYNPFRYYRHGIFLPFSFIGIYSHDFSEDATAFVGATYISTNPWGDKRIDFSAGYDVSYNNGGMKLAFSGGDDSFQYALSGTCIFDKEGFMQTFDTLQLAKVLWRGKVGSFALGTNGNLLYGRQVTDENLEKGRDDSTGKSADFLSYILFDNSHKVAPNQFYIAGVSLMPFVLNSYRDTEKRLIADKYVNAGAKLTVKFPLLIPFTFSATLFPSSNYAAMGSAQAILFDLEIHKGIPAVSLFVQRFVLSATYTGKIHYVHDDFWDIKRSEEIFRNVDKKDFSDSIAFDSDFYLSPNTGAFASSSFQFSLGYTVIYRPNPRWNEKRVVYGITGKANY